MTRGILIAAHESSLAEALSVAARARAQTVAEALAPDRLSPAERPASGDAMVWNPSSSLSARAVAIGAENRLGRLDEAILVCSPAALRRRPDELAPAEIDALCDEQVKGWLFLAREIAAVYRKRGSGTLAFVLSEAGLGSGRDEAPDLGGCVAAAAFRAFAQGLMAASFKEPYRVIGFSSGEAESEAAYAEYVLKVLDEGNKRDGGKWHKFGKGGLFSLLG